MIAARGENWKRNLLVVWLSQYIGMMGFGCAMPFIPMLLRDKLGITDDSIRGMYVSMYQFCGMISLCGAHFVWGLIADKFGYKIMLLRACIASAVMFPMLAFAPNIGVLLVLRFLTSFFSGTYNAAQTLLLTTTPQEKHGYMLGVLSTSLYSGHMSGYLVGGLIVEYFGYDAAFFTCGAMYAVAAVMVQIFVYDKFDRNQVKIRSKKQKFPLRDILTPAVFSLLALFLIMGVARRIDDPFVAMLVEAVNGQEKEAFFTSIVSAGAAIGGFLAGLIIGRLCDKVAAPLLFYPLLAVAVVCTLGQAFTNSIWALLGLRSMAFFAGGGLAPVLQVMLSRNTDPNFRGAFFGMSSSLNTAGGVICALLSGPIAYYFNVRMIMVVAAVLLFMMGPLAYYTFSLLRRRAAQQQ